VFNVSIPGARLKLVGGDVGLIAHETWVSSVVIAPAERYIVDVRFDSIGRVPIAQSRPGRRSAFARVFFDETDTLGIVTVAPSPPHGDAGGRGVRPVARERECRA
jgi:FtsP/CotA-like multicopper oxidase with cupredoxin domain